MHKIAMVTPGNLPVPAINGGAVEVLITDLIEANEIDEKYKIDLYTIQTEGLEEYQYKYTNIIQVNYNKLERFVDYGLDKIFRTINRNMSYRLIDYKIAGKIVKEYDLIIIQNTMSLYKAVYNTHKKQKYVYHMHNDVDMYRNYKYCNFVGKTCERVIAISEYIKERFESNAKVYGKTEILYNCVDFQKFSCKDIDVGKLKSEWNISSDDVVFFFSGRINKDKGVTELLEAFKMLSQKYSNVKLIIIGSAVFGSKRKNQYEEQVNRLAADMKNKVVFTGYVESERIPSIYQIADVAVVPSMWEEPFGVVALEIMAMKKPIIVTRSGGLTEVVDSESAKIVDKSEKVVENLFHAMEEFYCMGEKRVEAGKKSYKYIKSIPAFDRENYYNNFCNIIDDVLRENQDKRR